MDFGEESKCICYSVAAFTRIQNLRGKAEIMGLKMSSILDGLHFGSCQTYKWRYSEGSCIWRRKALEKIPG